MQSQDQKTDDLKNEPLYGVIHSVLRDHLERGALMDGLVLGEASVARAFQTSRMPASIALKLLHKEGLISDFEGRGYLVRGRRRGSPEPRRLDLGQAGLELPAYLAEPRRIRNRRNHIYRAVEHSVAACVVYGRFLLNESALAEHFNVSRTIAHEVLTQLERTGIAVQDRNQRWYAGPLTAADVAHHFRASLAVGAGSASSVVSSSERQASSTRRRDRVRRARNSQIAAWRARADRARSSSGHSGPLPQQDIARGDRAQPTGHRRDLFDVRILSAYPGAFEDVRRTSYRSTTPCWTETRNPPPPRSKRTCDGRCDPISIFWRV